MKYKPHKLSKVKRPKKEEFNQGFIDTMMGLAKNGDIICKCPGCQIPLTYDELKDLDCNSCGKIEFGKITVFAATEMDWILS